jgi:enterochelin esterase-like enzyme
MRVITLLRIITIVLIAGVLTGCAVATPTTEATETTVVIESATETITPIPTATPTESVCQETSGRVERVQMTSEVLASLLWVSVYTPPCYADQPEEEYPVLYLLHGQNMDDNYWQTLGAPQIADEAILAGERPFLMVMPYEARNFDPPRDSTFDEALIDELIPWVDANYATCTERECRAIGGISRGGGWAVHVALRNFELFGAVGAHSAGMMGDGWRIAQLLDTHKPNEFPHYYIDRGEDDFLAGYIDQFEAVLTSGEIEHEFVISPGAHNDSYWQAHVQEYMRWYMAGW